jgi:hypothetical protein
LGRYTTTPAREAWKALIRAEHGDNVRFFWTATGYLKAHLARGLVRGSTLGVFDAHRDVALNADFSEITREPG